MITPTAISSIRHTSLRPAACIRRTPMAAPRRRFAVLTCLLTTVLPMPAFAQAAATPNQDGLFLIAAILAVAGFMVYMRIDDKPEATRSAQEKRLHGAASVAAILGALGLYATHGETWTVKGLAQTVGLYANQPLAARPFFDESAVNAETIRRQQAASERTRISQDMLMLDQQLRDNQSRDRQLRDSIASTEQTQRSLQLRRDALLATNADLTLCLKAIDATLDVTESAAAQRYTDGEQVLGALGTAVCTYQYANSEPFRGRVNRVLADLRVIKGDIDQAQGHLRSWQSQLAQLTQQASLARTQITSLQHQHQQLATIAP